MARCLCRVVGLACLVLVVINVAVAGATQYNVGGDGGWGVPDAGAESYNSWADKTSFQIGDQLLFVYPKDKDSVLLVQPGDYNACNTASYDKKFSDGSTSVTLDRSGAFFFISGVDANCRANEKLIVMVAAGNTSPPASTSSSPPSSSGAQPSPPDAPAAAATGKNSTASNGAPHAPAGDKNGAGLTVAGLAGSLVASIAYGFLAI